MLKFYFHNEFALSGLIISRDLMRSRQVDLTSQSLSSQVF